MEASTLHAPAPITRITIAGPLLRLRSDEQLVALFRAGCDDAFRVIHDRYRARLLAYARQMLGACGHDAEDALQDVFVRAYATLRSDRRPVTLRAWLYRVAHNRCIDQLRRPVLLADDLLAASRAPLQDPPLVCEQREELRRLVIDVGRLPAQQRSALVLRELQGLSYEEMADSLDVSVAAVKSLLVRARGGLLDSAQARDASCGSVRREIALACDRGVRTGGLTRRHLRDCTGCRRYRDDLRGMRRRFAALGSMGPLGLIAQSVGLGGSGAAVGGLGLVSASGAGTVVTAAKIALVCAAAVTARGALDVTTGPVRQPPPAARHRVVSAPRAPTQPAAGAGVPANALPAPRGAHLPLSVAPAQPPFTASEDTAPRRRHRPSLPTFLTGQDSYPPVSATPAPVSSTPLLGLGAPDAAPAQGAKPSAGAQTAGPPNTVAAGDPSAASPGRPGPGSAPASAGATPGISGGDGAGTPGTAGGGVRPNGSSATATPASGTTPTPGSGSSASASSEQAPGAGSSSASRPAA